MEQSTVLYIRQHGACGDGKAKDTKALQRCIDLCHRQGGGTVVLDRGVFVCGTIYMKGNAQAFPNEGSIYRPMMMRFLRCRNIYLSGVRLLEAAAWTTAFLDSSHIHVEHVTIKNETNYNGDGLDFDGCSHVFVQGCSITGTDDNLCLQAGSREYPTEQVHISNCTFTSLCAGIRIGLKSVGDIRNVVISNCTMKNVWREGIKIECTEGGGISNILVQNVAMQNVSRPVFVISRPGRPLIVTIRGDI